MSEPLKEVTPEQIGEALKEASPKREWVRDNWQFSMAQSRWESASAHKYRMAVKLAEAKRMLAQAEAEFEKAITAFNVASIGEAQEWQNFAKFRVVTRFDNGQPEDGNAKEEDEEE